MKNKISVFLFSILLMFSLTVSAFAITSYEVHQHHIQKKTEENTQNTNSYYTCLDCGQEVYKCPNCAEVYSSQIEKCAYCGAKREKLLSEQEMLIDDCRKSFIGAVLCLVLMIGLTIWLVCYCKKNGGPEASISAVVYAYCFLAFFIFLMLHGKLDSIITFLKNGTLF